MAAFLPKKNRFLHFTATMMSPRKNKDFNAVPLHTAGSKLRALAHLLMAYDSQVGVAVDFDLWPELGLILDELGQQVVEISKDLERQQMQKLKPRLNGEDQTI